MRTPARWRTKYLCNLRTPAPVGDEAPSERVTIDFDPILWAVLALIGAAGVSQGIAGLAVARLRARGRLQRLILGDIRELASCGRLDRVEMLLGYVGGELAESVAAGDLYFAPDPKRPIRVDRRTAPTDEYARSLGRLAAMYFLVGAFFLCCGGVLATIPLMILAGHAGLCALHVHELAERVQLGTDRILEEVLRLRRSSHRASRIGWSVVDGKTPGSKFDLEGTGPPRRTIEESAGPSRIAGSTRVAPGRSSSCR